MIRKYTDKYLPSINETIEERDKKEHEFKSDYGMSLKNFMENRDLKADAVGKLIGYDKQHIYGICSGKKAPSLFCLWRIKEALNISLDYLLDFDKRVNSFSDSDAEQSKSDSKKSVLLDKINKLNDDIAIEVLIKTVDSLNEYKKSIVNEEIKY